MEWWMGWGYKSGGSTGGVGEVAQYYGHNCIIVECHGQIDIGHHTCSMVN